MSFQSLNKDELQAVAEFFAVDVVTSEEDKEPTKKELLASLASGDDPVTWEQYKEIYLVAKETGNDKPVEEKAEVESEPDEPVEDKYADSETVLIKYERKNPTFEILGYTFTNRHPYASVPEPVAEHLVRNVKGFRLALGSEVRDYYN